MNVYVTELVSTNNIALNNFIYYPTIKYFDINLDKAEIIDHPYKKIDNIQQLDNIKSKLDDLRKKKFLHILNSYLEIPNIKLKSLNADTNTDTDTYDFNYHNFDPLKDDQLFKKKISSSKSEKNPYTSKSSKTFKTSMYYYKTLSDFKLPYYDLENISNLNVLKNYDDNTISINITSGILLKPAYNCDTCGKVSKTFTGICDLCIKIVLSSSVYYPLQDDDFMTVCGHLYEIPNTGFIEDISKLTSKITLVFSGSDSTSDLFSNADLIPIYDPIIGGWVHGGFYKKAIQWKKAIEYRLNLKKINNTGICGLYNKPIDLVGHSLGGGIAIILSAWLRREYNCIVNITTFGTPFPYMTIDNDNKEVLNINMYRGFYYNSCPFIPSRNDPVSIILKFINFDGVPKQIPLRKIQNTNYMCSNTNITYDNMYFSSRLSTISNNILGSSEHRTDEYIDKINHLNTGCKNEMSYCV